MQCGKRGARAGPAPVLPGVRLADRTLDVGTCTRLDAAVTLAHSGRQFADGGAWNPGDLALG
jgi:hypothetical protein